jgi:hypothetical protein
MYEDRRTGKKPVPENLDKYLNEAQLSALQEVEGLGWKLMFIRRPSQRKTVAVVVDAKGHIMGVLENDGSINKQSDIIIRK